VPGRFQAAVEMLVDMVNDRQTHWYAATSSTSPRSR
jgi:hypothetical protein